ncbi:TetR/AcrR family transcriptional regulator [Vibrio rarus]|uniref:TetR/AcrR family transcriptional regulator n=1 Tax=Vibrio rarus TaxID=413403 RepID=UPI0021C418A9|nr:TetR/AcrR family transcriptional regulator [Vibrio rarus]
MSAGRKRAFDKELALKTAMCVFWSRGYGGTSVAQLSTALNINTSSLYAAFGSKDKLYKSCLEYYIEHYISPVYEGIQFPNDATGMQGLKRYFESLIDLFVNLETPKGCLLIKSTSETENPLFPSDVKEFLKIQGERIYQITFSFVQASFTGQDSEYQASLANLITMVSNGIAVQAAAGQPKETLNKCADQFTSILQLH